MAASVCTQAGEYLVFTGRAYLPGVDHKFETQVFKAEADGTAPVNGPTLDFEKYATADADAAGHMRLCQSEELQVVVTDQPLVGWRCWVVGRGPTSFLYSWRSKVWLPRVVMRAQHRAFAGSGNRGVAPFCGAICFAQPGTMGADLDYYRCGVHACQTLEDLTRGFLSELYVDYAPRVLCVGTVWLWGLIIRHTHGYLAEFAYPRTFDQLWRTEAAELKRLSTLCTLSQLRSQFETIDDERGGDKP